MNRLLLVCLLFGGLFVNAIAQESSQHKLAVLWTSGDPDVAEKVCFMYTHNAAKQGWFDEVVLIVWGPSARLLAGDKELQSKIQMMQQDGIKIEACITCANMYGVSQNLAEMNIDVKGMGMPLTRYLKEGWKTLTF